jgi:hypothetical protein
MCHMSTMMDEEDLAGRNLQENAPPVAPSSRLQRRGEYLGHVVWLIPQTESSHNYLGRL